MFWPPPHELLLKVKIISALPGFFSLCRRPATSVTVGQRGGGRKQMDLGNCVLGLVENQWTGPEETVGFPVVMLGETWAICLSGSLCSLFV